MPQNPSFIAGENLEPSRIVIADEGDYVVKKATGATVPFVGVTHEGTREAPIPGITPMAALAGESVRIYGDTEVCEVEAAADLDEGVLVTSNADARAVAAGAGNFYLGRSIASALNGERIRIQIQPGQLN